MENLENVKRIVNMCLFKNTTIVNRIRIARMHIFQQTWMLMAWFSPRLIPNQKVLPDPEDCSNRSL